MTCRHNLFKDFNKLLAYSQKMLKFLKEKVFGCLEKSSLLFANVLKKKFDCRKKRASLF